MCEFVKPSSWYEENIDFAHLPCYCQPMNVWLAKIRFLVMSTFWNWVLKIRPMTVFFLKCELEISWSCIIQISLNISPFINSLSFLDNKTFPFTHFHSCLISQRCYRTAGWISPLTWWRRRTLRRRRRWRMWKPKTVIFELNPRIWEVIQIRPIYSHLVQNLAEDGLNFIKVSETSFTTEMVIQGWRRRWK